MAFMNFPQISSWSLPESSVRNFVIIKQVLVSNENKNFL